MSRFDYVLIADWSGGRPTGPTPRKDAIWLALSKGDEAVESYYMPSRTDAELYITEQLQEALDSGKRVFLGIDIALSFPNGFAQALLGQEDVFALWDWFEAHIEDHAEGNNRFDLAAQINLQLGQAGPFWGNGLKRDIAGLPRRRPPAFSFDFAPMRTADRFVPGVFEPWQMSGAGAVGGQIFMGLPMLARLRRTFGSALSVWPFEHAETAIVIAEIWPGLIAHDVKRAEAQGDIRDAAQVRLLAEALARCNSAQWQALCPPDAPSEGYILGQNASDLLRSPQELRPPPLRNDCFALPPGVTWTPVGEALDLLRSKLSLRVGQEQISLGVTHGRILAEEVLAQRSNPPTANSAIDGYGFDHRSIGLHQEGDIYTLPLLAGASEAGKPFGKSVPPGHALRVLTGAILPKGVDTLVLDEDTTRGAGKIAFRGPIKPRQNTRKAGEDVAQGDVLFGQGHLLGAADLALLSATGLSELRVYKPLRVGILSTGDEIRQPGEGVSEHQIFDANRPMLRAVLARWGYEVVDLGHVRDDRDAVIARLDRAAQECDALLTSGGASAGDADHISAVLRSAGHLVSWRIALKPGRPLALGMWQGCPVFGLPGNPVAAWVCTLIFARPALSRLGGGEWLEPQGFLVPAAFSKRKKPGRMEYLRARMRDGQAEVFHSEGSGRISGLSWSDGLVELPHEALSLAPGDMVRFLPYSSFGIG